MNGEVCCILGICCPPQERAAALAKELCHDEKSPLCGDPEQAQLVAEYIFSHFDLAPAGKLQPLVAFVAGMAKGQQKKA